jgi:hypothetical protein
VSVTANPERGNPVSEENPKEPQCLFPAYICAESQRLWDAEIEKRKALESALSQAQKERDELRAEVKEWLCVQCNTVYPGPPQPGFRCVICPKCEGDTGPKVSMQLRAERQARKEAEEKLASEIEVREQLAIDAVTLDEKLSIARKALETLSKNCGNFENIQDIAKEALEKLNG